MITLSARAAGAIQRSYTIWSRFSSFLDGDLLADDIPVDPSSAQEMGQRSLAVPDRVTFSVPRISGNVDWTPNTDRAALAANGQRIRVELGIGLGASEIEWFTRGEFLIVESEVQGDQVAVECQSLLYLADEAKLVMPFQPTGTYKASIRSLMEPGVTVVFDANLSDGTMPGGMNFEGSRVQAMSEICDAWPADYLMDAEGYLYVYSTIVDAPVVGSVSEDPAAGTIIESVGKSTREGAYNMVVVRGQDSTGAQIQGVAYDLNGGAKAYGGPFNALPVPYFYESPLIVTPAQARRAATAVMKRLQRDTSRSIEIEMVPDPRIQLGDLLDITSVAYTGLGEVDALQLPYGPTGSAHLTVRTVRR